MSGTQSIDVEGGRVANGQESPEIDVEIESENTLDADSESRKVYNDKLLIVCKLTRMLFTCEFSNKLRLISNLF